MTDSNLLELAKLGDPQAIAALMNQSLQSRGMNAIVERQGDCLEVTLEAERIPNRRALTAFVQQGINNLGIQSITSIRILGQQVGASYPAWMQEVQLGAQGNPLSNPLGGLDDLNNLAATTPLNIQPETETEITAIPLSGLSGQDEATRGAESVDLNAADLSFLPDAEPDVTTDELLDAELSSSDEISDEILAALMEPAPSDELPALELESETETDIAPDFLQELLVDAEGSDRSLFAESPDGPLDTLEGSPVEDADAELDLFFDELEPSDTTQPESGELDADLLDFLNQPDADLVDGEIQSDIQPDFTLDTLLDPSAELTDADLADLTDANLDANSTATPASASEQSDLFDNAEINEFAAPPTDSLLSSQIEELFDAELDQPDSGYIEEILPERPTDTTEDLRQALVEAPLSESAPEAQDPWTVSVLPELSEARTVLDLDDEPEGELPAFMVAPRPDSPDAPIEPDSLDQLLAEADSSSQATDAEAADDLDSLFAESEFTESEEPPISTLQNDSIFYGSIADEEIAEEDLVEELPPDFLQDFAEFPDGFSDQFSEVAPPAEALSEPPQADLPLGDDDPAALSISEQSISEQSISEQPASNDLAAELAALDLTDTPAEPTALEPPRDFELTASDQVVAPVDRADQNPDQSSTDFTPVDLTVAPDSDLTFDLEADLETDLETDSENTEDADLADLLSETPQGTPLGASPAEISPSPQPEDFFSEPIAPVGATLETAPEAGSPVSLPPSELPPEVSQDALEAGLGDFRAGLVEPLPEEFFIDDPHPTEADWQTDLRDPLDLSDDSEANYVIEDSTPAVVYTPPPLPESDKTPTPDRSSSSWLFPLVLLFVVAWIAGLLGFTLFRSRFEPLPSPPPAGESPDAPPASPTPASPTSQQPAPSSVANLSQGALLESAVEQASAAVALTQAAQSADDWGLVANKWQQAINLLKTVPSTSPDYAAAQQKLTEYGANVTTARQKANLPIVAAAPLSVANVAQANSPSPTASPNASPNSSPNAAGVVCSAVASTPNSQPVELSRVQFDPTVDQAQASPLVGCITNHTEQPITAVNVAYKNSSAAEATTGNLSFGQLDPKQTVPFKSGFTITPQVKNLTIASILWTAAGTSNAKELPAAISVTRGNEDG